MPQTSLNIMEYQIEMLWKCCGCQTINKGLDKHCSECGKPKSNKDEEFFPENISEKNALLGSNREKALAGPDWKCKYCNSLQAAYKHFCSECGCEKEIGSKEYQTEEKVITEFNNKKTVKNKTVTVTVEPSSIKNKSSNKVTSKPEIIEPIKFKSAFITKNKILDDLQEDEEVNKILKSALNKKYKTLKIFSISLLIICIIAFILFRLFSTHSVELTVSGKKWERNLIIEKYDLVSKSGWSPSLNAIDVSHSLKIHHYDKVVSGSHQETYNERYQCGEDCSTISGNCTRTCKSNKNGTATCNKICSPDKKTCNPKYCNRQKTRTITDYTDVPIYKDWYSWKEYDWIFYDKLESSGTDEDPYWKSFDESSNFRSRKDYHYEITLSSTDDSYIREVEENLFLSIKKNQKCNGVVDGFGTLRNFYCN